MDGLFRIDAYTSLNILRLQYYKLFFNWRRYVNIFSKYVPKMTIYKRLNRLNTFYNEVI